MTTGTTRGPKPSGIMRLFLRFPIWLYRLNLGWLLGNRFVMFQHTGRKSGLPRYTVVEVVQYNRSTGTYIIASGWGEKSDWFQNMQKEPEIILDTGRKKVRATAVRLSVEEATAALQEYATSHPVAFRQLGKMMMGGEVENNRAGCTSLAQVVPLVILRPHS